MASHLFSRRFHALLWVMTILLTGLGASVAAAQISGRGPTVIDTATLDMAGQRVRLFGLQAVTPTQNCAIGALVWACGQEARWAATNRVGNHWVVCEERASGTEGEVSAVCYLGGVGGPELNAWLVEEGWALAARDEPAAYLAHEERARAAGRGLWRGQ